MIWTNSYERLTWTPILVLIALKIDSPAALAYSASAYSAANLVGNILFGTMSDRFGRYKIAGIALLGLMVTTLLHLQAWSALALVAVRFADGFFAAAVTPSSLAAASETAPAAGTGQVMARMGLMIGSRASSLLRLPVVSSPGSTSPPRCSFKRSSYSSSADWV